MSTPTTTPSTTPRHRQPWFVAAMIGGIAVVAVGLWLTQPWLLFVDEVASESLPLSITDTTTTEQPSPDDGAVAASDDPAAAAEPTITDEMGQDAGQPDGSAVNAPVSSPAPDPTATAAPEPDGPVVLASGSFISRDHGTSGEAALVALPDGTRVLTIEGLDTDNGPDLYVYLDDDAADAPEDEFDDGIDLGRLRANQGDLVYEIPDDVDLDGVASVGIWCDRFGSLFGAADLVPVG